MSYEDRHETLVLDKPHEIAFFQMCARRGALRLEIAGLKRRGRSAYSICKEVYGIKGNRQSVLDQMNALIEQTLADAQAQADEALRKNTDHGRGDGRTSRLVRAICNFGHYRQPSWVCLSGYPPSIIGHNRACE